MTATASSQINFEQSISINQDGTTPHSSAILDVKSTDKGLLIPRMTTAQRSAIIGTEGLMVYDTTSDSFWYHDGSAWSEISDGAFEIVNNVVRSAGNNNVDDFVFGDDTLPPNAQNVTEKLFFFDKSKSAFRTGELSSSSNWASDSLGRSSFGAGLNALAKGDYSTAFGHSTMAIGDYSTAMGEGTRSIRDHSLVIGEYNEVISSQFAPQAFISLFAVGNGISDNFRSTAFSILQDGSIVGNGSGIFYSSGSGSATPPERPKPLVVREEKSFALDSVAIFSVSTKSPIPSNQTAIGALSSGIRVIDTSIPPGPPNFLGQGSFSTGINTFSWATASSALGIGILSHGYSGTVEGLYNDTLDVAPQTSPTSQTSLFVVGNGDDDMNRSNAFVIRKNGQVEIGSTILKDTFNTSNSESVLRMGANVTPGEDNKNNSGGSNFRWDKVFATNGTIQTSDIRVKKNIGDIQYGLKDILNLRPVVYNWNKERDNAAQTLGLIAQELQEVIPEVINVPEDQNDLLGVNYAELIPVLIKGIQEQQDLIKELQSQILSQNKKIILLENIMINNTE